MTSAQGSRSSTLFNPQYVNGVYIPCALLVFGTAIVKREWIPYAVVLAALVGSWKVYNNRKLTTPRLAMIAF